MRDTEVEQGECKNKKVNSGISYGGWFMILLSNLTTSYSSGIFCGAFRNLRTVHRVTLVKGGP